MIEEIPIVIGVLWFGKFSCPMLDRCCPFDCVDIVDYSEWMILTVVASLSEDERRWFCFSHNSYRMLRKHHSFLEL